MTASDSKNIATVQDVHNSPPQDWVNDESEGEYDEVAAPRGVWWFFGVVMAVIFYLTVSNGYAIERINARLTRNSDVAINFEMSIIEKIGRSNDRIYQKLSAMNTNITQLEEGYHRIAGQEDSMLMMFKRLSDHYDDIGRQFRKVNSDSDDL